MTFSSPICWHLVNSLVNTVWSWLLEILMLRAWWFIKFVAVYVNSFYMLSVSTFFTDNSHRQASSDKWSVSFSAPIAHHGLQCCCWRRKSSIRHPSYWHSTGGSITLLERNLSLSANTYIFKNIVRKIFTVYCPEFVVSGKKFGSIILVALTAHHAGPAFGWGERGPCPGRWLRGGAKKAVTDRPHVNTWHCGMAISSFADEKSCKGFFFLIWLYWL
jgi:hypothetical protein